MGTYIRLVDINDAKGKESAFLSAVQDKSSAIRFETSAENFSKIPGSPVAYFFTQRIFDIFDNNKPLSDIAITRLGMTTADNARFTRFWYEPVLDKCLLSARNADDVMQSGRKWVPYNKGGKFRKWYGNLDVCVNWSNDGNEIKNFADENGCIRSTVPNTEYYFLPCITWSKISSGNIAFRFRSQGSIFDVAGACLYSDKKIYLLGLLNSKICMHILSVLSPTLNFEGGHISSIPIAIRNEVEVIGIVEQNISFSRADWDAFETSWDFRRHPLLCGERTVAAAYAKWESKVAERFESLKANEKELNRIFIDIYGLADELSPEVEDKDVTVRRADLGREIRSLISYGIGCMFGRYSLDLEGLAYAGGNWDWSKYETFIPDHDNCIPITDEEYFDDDIVSRFVEFVKTVYGTESLEENLDFIAEVLGNRGDTPLKTIRNYFINEFYKDHVKTYQKRPIYWLFESGKENGFKALIYMHRYNTDTIGNMRIEYIHKLQAKYESQQSFEQHIIDTSQNQREKTAAIKQKEKLIRQIKEIKDYDVKIAHLANCRIEIDLDDGVKVNYEKVQTGKDGKKLEVLGKI